MPQSLGSGERDGWVVAWNLRRTGRYALVNGPGGVRPLRAENRRAIWIRLVNTGTYTQLMPKAPRSSSESTSSGPTPNLGGPAEDEWEVVDVLSGKLRRQIDFQGQRYLDIGCGNGAFTLRLGSGFDEVHGVDVEQERLADFERKIRQNRATNVTAHLMSAEALDFPDDYFDVVTAIETIEHIPDLDSALDEIFRVLKPGGLFGITAPNRLFPFETHGIWWKGEERGGRVPLLPYVPPLHDRLALARVFTNRSLKRLLEPRGFTRIGLDYAYPTLERGHRFGRWASSLKGRMRKLEESKMRCFGVSIVTTYQKTPSAVPLNG